MSYLGSSRRHPRSEEHRRPKVSSPNSSRSSASSSYTSRDDYIDSHCHLDRLYSRHQFRGCLGAFLWKYSPGYNPNFLGCVTNFCDPDWLQANTSELREILESKRMYGTIGWHPSTVKQLDEQTLSWIKDLASSPKIRAIGEIGLDYHRRLSEEAKRNLLAVDLGKPVVIHCRDAEEDLFTVLRRFLPRHWEVHFQCMSEEWVFAKRWLHLFSNSYVGLTPMIIWPDNWRARNTAKEIPLNRLLLETDAPYFVPKQLKGTKANSDPTMAIAVPEEVARLKHIPLRDVLSHTRRNARAMYNLAM